MSRPAVLEQDRGAWMADALDYLVARASKVGTVSVEDVHRDLPPADDHQMYGTLFRIASGRNLITRHASGPSPRRSRRGGDRNVWALHPEQLRGAA